MAARTRICVCVYVSRFLTRASLTCLCGRAAGAKGGETGDISTYFGAQTCAESPPALPSPSSMPSHPPESDITAEATLGDQTRGVPFVNAMIAFRTPPSLTGATRPCRIRHDSAACAPGLQVLVRRPSRDSRAVVNPEPPSTSCLLAQTDVEEITPGPVTRHNVARDQAQRGTWQVPSRQKRKLWCCDSCVAVSFQPPCFGWRPPFTGTGPTTGFSQVFVSALVANELPAYRYLSSFQLLPPTLQGHVALLSTWPLPVIGSSYVPEMSFFAIGHDSITDSRFSSG
jgi:hypothetical protein